MEKKDIVWAITCARQSHALLTNTRDAVKEHIQQNTSVADLICTFDKTFVRKILRHPGDITAIRLEKVLTKLDELS